MQRNDKSHTSSVLEIFEYWRNFFPDYIVRGNVLNVSGHILFRYWFYESWDHCCWKVQMIVIMKIHWFTWCLSIIFRLFSSTIYCIQVESIEWAYENIGEITSKGQLNNMADFLAHKQLDLVINLPMRHGGARRVSSFSTHGNIQITAN